MRVRVAKTAYMSPKCIADTTISSMVTRLIRSDWKYPIERFRVLNPPVAAMLNAWLTASKKGIPAAQRDRHDTTVSPRYTDVMTQTTLEELYLYPSFERDDSSMFVSFRRYGLAEGMTIRRKTTTPSPPI